MQTSTINQATLSPQVQAILPILENLKDEDYDFLFNFLTKKNIKKSEQTLSLSREEIAKKRLGFFQGQITMSDDFDDYLGDDFWFPEDDILYK
ncbi:hypothetical protein [Moraxella oblonga]|uniref:hypothetical protein n=1 Tax=Moraxella oblonga TaxID=200413 RepID=UPI00082E9F34|nr:hypothetical protein [Moraxella oblonga]